VGWTGDRDGDRGGDDEEWRLLNVSYTLGHTLSALHVLGHNKVTTRTGIETRAGTGVIEERQGRCRGDDVPSVHIPVLAFIKDRRTGAARSDGKDDDSEVLNLAAGIVRYGGRELRV
jgi:hypothetical protein